MVECRAPRLLVSSKGLIMGIFDTAQSFINRGVASAERGGKTISLKVELADANRQLEQAYAKLGEQVFATMGTDAVFRAGREEVLSEVEECLAKKSEIEDRIAGIEAEGAAARAAAAATRSCPSCGAQVSGMYKFCPSCGTRAPEPEPEPAISPDEKVCPNCGFVPDVPSQFCMQCGTRFDDAAPVAQQPEQPAQPQQPAWQ